MKATSFKKFRMALFLLGLSGIVQAHAQQTNPVIVSVSTRGNPKAVYVTYNTNVLTDGTYSISQGINPVAVNSVAYGASQHEIVLATTTLTPDVTNTLTAANVHDLAGDVIGPNPTVVDFQHGAEYPQFRILYRRFIFINNVFCLFGPCPTELLEVARSDLPDFEAPSNVGENYTAILLGLFVAPQDGDYRFWMSSDDTGGTYVATDANPAHKVQICAEPAWGQVRGYADAGHDNNDGRGTPPIYDPAGSGNKTGNGSLPIPLTAGQVVYLEGVFVEGGGGDNYACTVTINDTNVPANGTEPISATNFMALRIATNGQFFSTFGSVFFTTQPTDQNAFEGKAAEFCAKVNGTPPYNYQWRKNGSPIAGGTSNIYATPPVTGADNGATFDVIVANDFGSVTSAVAVLTVVSNPVIVSVSTHGNPNKIYLTYNKDVQAVGTYTISNSVDSTVITATAAAGTTATQIELTPAWALTPDIGYVLIAAGVQDTSGNFIEPDPAAFAFVHGAEYPAFCVYYERYDDVDVGIGILNAFLTSSKYVNHQPDVVRTDFTLLESPNNQRDNFGDRLAAFYVAPSNAIYHFWISTDDQGAGYIATDANPAHKVQICAEPAWAQVRAWEQTGGDNGGRGIPPIYNPPLNTTGNGSVGIPLTAGQVVYLEVLHTEGGGGDNSAMTVTGGEVDDWTAPPNGTLPIACADLRRTRVTPDGTFFVTLGDIAIIQQPADQTRYVGQSAMFTVGIDGTPSYGIQWLRNGSPIAGANGSSYTSEPAVLAEDGAVYSVSVSNSFSSAISSNAIFHVLLNPVVVSCATRGDTNHLYVLFNRPVHLNGTYGISGGIIEAARVYGSNSNEVVLTTSPFAPDTAYTMTIQDVTDAASGSFLATNPTVVTFVQGPGRLCTDFSSGLPAGTIASGVTPPSVGADGVLHITDRVNSQLNYWTIPLAGVQNFQCFKAQWKTYLEGIGGADGISFNVGVGPFAYTQGVPEEGASTGLSVTIDTFDNGFDGGAEVGIEVRWNGVRQSFLRVGSGTANGPAELMLARFVDTSVEVDNDGLAIFRYDTLVTSAQLPNYGGIRANRYEFAARTGGANENFWIDDVCINDFTLGAVALSLAPTTTVTVNESATVTFTANVTGSPCYVYQWSKNGTPIPGATGATYTTPPLFGTDDQSVFSIAVNNDFSSANASSTVTVMATNVGPTLSALTSSGGNLVIEWSDPSFHLQCATNLGPNANWQDLQGVQSPYPITNPRTGNRFYRLVSP